MLKFSSRRIYCNILLVAVSLNAWSQAARADEEAGQLPVDWFVLPEDAASYKDTSSPTATAAHRGGIFFRRGEDASARALDKIFGSSATALDASADVLGGRSPPPNAPDDWVPWHLKEIILDLGASLQGTLGILTAKGAVSAEVYWRRVKAQKQTLGLYVEDTSESPEPVDLVLNDTTSKAELYERIEPLVNAVMATGRVSDSERVRTGLTQTAEQLQDLMVGINSENYAAWEVAKFRLEVSISGSGTVSPGTMVGAAVRLRFDWARQKGKVEIRPDGESESRIKMRRLLTGMASDLDTINRDLYASSGFDLKGFRIGIGMFLKGSIGVVKGSVDLFGYAMFSRVAAARTPPTGVRIIPDDKIKLFGASVSAQHLSYADQHKVRHERFVDPKTGAEKVVYYMDRPKFREGLSRAAKMGALFASRAAKNSGQKWFVEEIKPQFALSLMGVAGVVTIGGTMSLEMTFKRAQ